MEAFYCIHHNCLNTGDWAIQAPTIDYIYGINKLCYTFSHNFRSVLAWKAEYLTNAKGIRREIPNQIREIDQTGRMTSPQQRGRNSATKH